MSLSCDSTDYRHSLEDHSHGPDTEYAHYIHSAHDTPLHHYGDGNEHYHDTNEDSFETQDTKPFETPVENRPTVIAPTPLRPAFRQLTSAESTGRRTPVAASRMSSFTVPRVATPTQARPFGSLMNGKYQPHFCGFLKHCLK